MRPAERSVDVTQVTEWADGSARFVQDSLAAEEPLEIRCSRLDRYDANSRSRSRVVCRIPADRRIIDLADQIAEIRPERSKSSPKSNVIQIELQNACFDPNDLRRNFFAASSCGICGKASIEAIRRRGLRQPDPDFHIDPELLCTLPEILRTNQAVFSRTGGLHAAALFDARGSMIALREDIGRHNAVDKIVGWALLGGHLPLARHVLLVSGRGGFEIVQKALAGGIPVLASVSAPSSLAVKLARELGLTLIGFLRGRRFVIYSGEFRCIPAESRGQATS